MSKSSANRYHATNFVGQELERSLGAAAPRTDFRVATCQLNALDNSSKEKPHRCLWWKVLVFVLWVTRVSDAGGSVRGSLDGRSSRILDSRRQEVTCREMRFMVCLENVRPSRR